ncbi:MAG: putative tricarboxylic transport rane protein, partial [Burkholderiales bacterium]
MSRNQKFAAIAFGLAIALPGAANAAWQPVKPIEFIATAGPGGGTDNFARAVQSIITKHKLVEQPIVV